MTAPASPQNIHNERTKLLAGAFDRLSTTCLTVGIVGPIAASLYGVPTTISASEFAVFAAIWLLVGTVLHFLARRILSGLLSA